MEGVRVDHKIARFACLIITMAALSVSAADPPGVKSWTSAELKDFEKSLASKMSAQKVASEALGSFGNHNMLVAHREGNGQGEVHEQQADVFVIQTGEAVIRLGGELVDGKQVRPNELLGSSVRGGVEKKLRAGDVIHVPAKTPHQMLVQSGQQVTYLVVKVTEH
jgi:mannose-6-phosphate isomerase-like protein (cupin superfamily)